MVSSRQAPIKLFSTSWCPDCEEIKSFLDGHDVSYVAVDVENDEASMAFLRRAADGKESVPTLLFPDGAILVEPSRAEVATKLGIRVDAAFRLYDLVIVGGGPAGLTAAIYAAREGMSTVVLEKAVPGGQAAITEWIENYPGFPEGVGGIDLSQRMEEQARRYGVEVLIPDEVVAIEPRQHYRIVRTQEGELHGRAVLLATGSSYRRLGVPGEDEFIGRGISYCATCDGPFFRDQEVLVIGGGNSAAEEGLFLTKFASKVTLLARRGELRASQVIVDNVQSHPKMVVQFHTVVKEIRGDKRVRSVVVENTLTGERSEIETGGVFVFIGLDPNTRFLKGQMRLDDAGFIVTGQTLETTLPGVFAAGDARSGSTKQVASAAGEGVTAALMVRHYLRGVLANPVPYDVPAA